MKKVILGEYYTALDYLDFENENIRNLVEMIVSKNFCIDVPYHLHTYYILDRLKSTTVRQAVIKKLIELNADPLEPFPTEHFENVTQVKKSIENLEKEYEYFMFYINKGKTFLNTNNLNTLAVNCDASILTFAFRTGYDMVIQLKKDKQCIIQLDLGLKNREFVLTNIHKKLNKMEKDKWMIYDDGLIVKTTKDNFTDINFETLIDYVKEFQLV